MKQSAKTDPTEPLAKPAWRWTVPDQFAARGSPGRPADSDKDAADKERRRHLARPRKHRSMAPRMPRVRSSAPSSQSPGEPEVTAFS
jgi:hypothetical protein